jgi:predicted nucleic acid-binding protein
MKKQKIYLDTNIIYGYFRKRVEETINRRKFKKPFILEKISKADYEFITSFFTMVEVSRNLRRDFNLDSRSIVDLLRLFTREYSVKVVQKVSITGELLLWHLKEIDLADAIQLNIAKNSKSIFLTNDKRLIKDARKFYPWVVSFSELLSTS